MLVAGAKLLELAMKMIQNARNAHIIFGGYRVLSKCWSGQWSFGFVTYQVSKSGDWRELGYWKDRFHKSRKRNKLW